MSKQQHEPSGLSVGDLVHCVSLRLKSELMPGTFVETTVRANKGKVLVALLIGEESVSGADSVDLLVVMREMGWQPIEGRELNHD